MGDDASVLANGAVLFVFVPLNGRSLVGEGSLDEILADGILSSEGKLAGDAEVHDGLFFKSKMLFDCSVLPVGVSLGCCVPVEQTPFGSTLPPTVLMGVDKVASLHTVYLSRQAFLRDIFRSRDRLLTKGALLMDGALDNDASLSVEGTSV